MKSRVNFAFAATKITLEILGIIFMLFLIIWIDHCSCEGKVSRSIKETFSGQTNPARQPGSL